MFECFGFGARILTNVFKMYFGLCFRKLDYVVVHPEDRDGHSEDLEANTPKIEQNGLIKTGKGQSKNVETSKEEEEEEDVLYERGDIIGRTKEGILIRAM